MSTRENIRLIARALLPNEQSVVIGVPVTEILFIMILAIQSELPQPIPWNSMEIDLGCTSRIYFNNVTLTLHSVTLTS